MTKVKKQGWINIGKYLPGEQYVTGVHPTEQLAESWKRKCPGKYIATIKIEWEK